MEQDNLTAKQKDYAVFLPAISGFYATFIGKQRNGNYVDPARMPKNIPDMEMMNWLNPQKGLFPYRWSLYSGGHANLDLTKQDWSEDMVRNRDPNTVMLGDSGGFQIAKGLWEGDWHANSGCPKAQKKREAVLKWLDGVADYGMTLDIPTWVIHDQDANSRIGTFKNPQELVDATKFNNDYFIKHRKGVAEGGTKFLNVLQGANHKDANEWYETMKHYCDPKKYPGRHFDGWGMGGQNMCDLDLVLRRIVTIIDDGLLQQGKHDWMHFLGTSRLEWALVLTDIQRAVRKYHNPDFTISFDCASPFLATANGQIYYNVDCPHNDKWVYRMDPSVDDKKYATDTRNFREAVVQDGIFEKFDHSPIVDNIEIKDVCIYKPGDLNKIGKEGKTSWDSFSYALQMGHNVWTHINAVQEANRQYDSGKAPAMLRDPFGYFTLKDLIEEIFSKPTKQERIELIDHYHDFWMNVKGTRGFTGKRASNSHTNFHLLFDIPDEVDNDEEDSVQLDIDALDQLEANQEK